MVRCSNKQVEKILKGGETLAGAAASTPSDNDDLLERQLLDRKIVLATEGFPITTKFCELILRDRNRLSEDNALTICEYVIAMKREMNPRLSYKRCTIHCLAQLSKEVGIAKKFIDMTRDDVLRYLDGYRKSENEDSLHRWIGSYNLNLVVLSRFFK